MKVHVENTIGLKAKEDLELDPAQTVQEVIDVIASNNLVDPNSISLTHEGKELPRDRSLKNLGIGEGAVVRTLPRDARGGRKPTLLELPPPLQSRLRSEAARVLSAGIPLRHLSPVDWEGQVPGSGRWANRTYRFRVTIPRAYPYHPPKVRFIDLIDPPHPNIGQDGAVCLNHFGDAWSPTMNLHSIYQDLAWLFANPNYEHPLNLAAMRKSVQSHWLKRLFFAE